MPGDREQRSQLEALHGERRRLDGLLAAPVNEQLQRQVEALAATVSGLAGDVELQRREVTRVRREARAAARELALERQRHEVEASRGLLPVFFGFIGLASALLAASQCAWLYAAVPAGSAWALVLAASSALSWLFGAYVYPPKLKPWSASARLARRVLPPGEGRAG